MRRPTSVLASAVLGTALAASTVTAQMSSSPASASGPGVEGSAAVPASVTASPSDAFVNPARGARHLLRNGWDYITYQEFDRALVFFREAERRQKELTDVERIKLQQGIERAQRGVREKAIGVKGEPAYARSGGQRRPGGLALARPAGSLAPASAVAAKAPAQPRSADTPRYEREPIQLAGGGGSNLNLQPATDLKPVTATVEAQPEPQPLVQPEPQPQQVPVSSPAPMPAPPEMEVPGVPLPKLGARPEVVTPTPVTVDPDLRPATVAETTPLPASEPVPSADPAGALPELPPPPQDVPLPVPANHLPVPATVPSPPPLGEPARVGSPAPANQPMSMPMPVPVNLPTVEDEQLVPLPPSLSDRPRAEPPTETVPTTAPTPAPIETPAPAPVLPTEMPQPQPLAGLPGSRSVEPSPAPAAAAATAELPPAPAAEDLPSSPSSAPPPGLITVGNKPSSLSPELQEEVARIAQRQDDELRQRPPVPAAAPGATPPGDITLPLSVTGPTNRSLEISRAPSPTEARPIKGIPVPEEFVTLPKREWDPNRKYWAAAATCHLPLYFQDASLERYGYSMEQRFGHAGRFLTYPLDDPRQSKQRMQLIQPLFSAGLMAFQIGMLPYNMLMDPPWEPEYDLGYYRPGDRVPTDVYYLPLTGVGPPLRGKNYGNPPGQGYNQPNSAAAFPAPRW